MKASRVPHLLLAISCLIAMVDLAQAQGTAFTYQGQLFAGNSPANGYYDFRFSLFATNSGGTAVGNVNAIDAVQVTNGLFSAILDFGNVFSGGSYWLEIGVRTNVTTNDFATLVPRQNITGTPYSQYSLSSASVSGVLSVANLPSNVALLNGNANFSGTVTAGYFYGNGSGLTNLSFAAVPQPNSTGQGLLSSTGFTALNSLQMAQLTATPFKTPPMGWMSWNCCGTGGAEESNCLNMAQNLLTNGLRSLGYNLIQIDAGWVGYRDTNGIIHESTTRFPDGMSNTIATLHSMGFKVGIWEALNLTNIAAVIADNPSAVVNTNFSNEQCLVNDAQTFINWGMDYVKLESFLGLLSGDEEQRWYQLFDSAAQSAGKPLYIMGAIGDVGPVGSDCFPWMYGVINARRSGAYDIGNYNGTPAVFNNYMGNFWFAAAHPEYSGPGCFISLDAIPSYDPAGPTYMLMTAMLNGELIWNSFGPDGAHISDAAYLTNLIQLDQDPAALMARCILTNGTVTVWQKYLGSAASSTFALAFFNTATSGAPVSTTISLQGLGANSPELLCLDLISNVTTVVSNNLTMTVPPMTAYGFKLAPYIGPGVGSSNLTANGVVTAGNVAVTGSITAGSFAGNGAGLTDITAENLNGVVAMTNGGLGVALSPNLVPPGSIYNDAVDGGNLGPACAVNLVAGVTYLLAYPANGNDLGLFDDQFDSYGPATSPGSGTFTVPSTGTYYLLASSNNTPVYATICVFNSKTNVVNIGADLTANNGSFNILSATESSLGNVIGGNIPGGLVSQVPLAIRQGQGTPSNLGDGSYIYSTNSQPGMNGSTLYLLRNATNGYADINFWTNRTLLFAIGASADANDFPYQQPYLESYGNRYDFNFVGGGGIFLGYDHVDQSWRGFNGRVENLGAYSDANLAWKLTTNGIASYGTTNGTSSSGSIAISSSGFTNTLLVNIQGYYAVTNASSATNFNSAGTSWSTNAGPFTNVLFMLQPGAKINTPANAIDISSVHWAAF